jgi:signal transduction histidine kinase
MSPLAGRAPRATTEPQAQAQPAAPEVHAIAQSDDLQRLREELEAARAQLIVFERMASLGRLAGGIAHEIKNPLNFVTNFATLTADLAGELREEIKRQQNKLDPSSLEAIEDLLVDIENNVAKINEHGHRAESIVRGMLLHSRGKDGERQPTDLNRLLEEYVNLAYHGLRAEDPTFNIKIESSFDDAIGQVSVVPQDLSRAFLNIVNNGCYAAHEKRKALGDSFKPTIRIVTRNCNDTVVVSIRDNGNGIPERIREKIFKPFFTTKPVGVGTGLGLSLTFDIVTKEHGGTIELDTKEGEYTEFILTIPKR